MISLFGTFLDVLGLFGGALGASWGAIGTLWGASWTLLGPPGAVLGASWAVLGLLTAGGLCWLGLALARARREGQGGELPPSASGDGLSDEFADDLTSSD